MAINLNATWPLFCLAATVLLILVSVSVPTWNQISFLNVGPNGPDQLRYGIFGYTNSKIAVGYRFSLDTVNDSELISPTLTRALILHPIAAGFSAFAVFSWANGILPAFFSLLAFLVTIAVFVIDLMLFLDARNKYRDANNTAELGNAIWITFGALISISLGFTFFGAHRRK